MYITQTYQLFIAFPFRDNVQIAAWDHFYKTS